MKRYEVVVHANGCPAAASWSMHDCMRIPLVEQYEVVYFELDQWAVEAIDHEGEGEIYRTLFMGPDAEGRAKKYAAAMNGEEVVACWQPIETAPKDGAVILLGRTEGKRPSVVWAGAWWPLRHGEQYPWLVLMPDNADVTNGYSDESSWSPTHWMPLPKAPESE